MILRGLFKAFFNIKYVLIFSIFISKAVSDDEDEFHPSAEVHSLDNDRIGNGGAVITVYGKDFAADTFNQFDPNIGNKVCKNLLESRFADFSFVQEDHKLNFLVKILVWK